MKPEQRLYDYCNANFAKAARLAEVKDKFSVRGCLFEALRALELLYNAEKRESVRAVYEAKASGILRLARLVRTDGFSEEVLSTFRDYLKYPDFMSAPAPEEWEPLTAKPAEIASADPVAAFEDKDEIKEVTEKPVDLLTPAEPAHVFEAPAEVNTSGRKYDAIGNALRPQYLKDYFGQPQTVALLTDAIKKARLSGEALPHVLLYGSHGLGKTTLAKIIANEMGTNFVEINNSKSLKPDELIQILSKLNSGDIIFIDEIHNLPTAVQEGVLYSAMEDFYVKYVFGKGKFTKTVSREIKRFTLIGATTESGRLLKPFKDRFGITCRLNPYSDEILATIAINSFARLGMTISDELALSIVKRARSTPRIANRFVKRIADKAIVEEAEKRGIFKSGSLDSIEKIRALRICVNRETAERYFYENGIDEYGLEDGDRMLLKVLIEKFNGGPAGQENLAKALNESVNVISNQYENYLLKLGFINILPKGRVAMPAAYRYFNLPVPENVAEFDAQNSERQTSLEAPVAEAKSPAAEPIEEKEEDAAEYEVTLNDEHPERAEKVTALINYEYAKEFKDIDFDGLFPDMERSYESAAKNISFVNWRGGDKERKIYCDSKLERRFIAYISSCNYVKDIKTQCLTLEYANENGTQKTYYPDFVLYTADNRVVILEMKNLKSASYHLNILKYAALKEYAKEHGYGYAEVCKDEELNRYVSVEQLKAMPRNEELHAHILSTLEEKEEENASFGKADLKAYLASHEGAKELDAHVILLNDQSLKNTDWTGDNLKIERAADDE